MEISLEDTFISRREKFTELIDQLEVEVNEYTYISPNKINEELTLLNQENQDDQRAVEIEAVIEHYPSIAENCKKKCETRSEGYPPSIQPEQEGQYVNHGVKRTYS